jgi:hypothetical protein
LATQTVEFRAATGLTITAKLFSAGSDTEVANVSATEATNRKGTYRASYTDVPAGEYQLIAFDSQPIPVAEWWTKLTLNTDTFGVYEKADTRDIAAGTLDIQSRLPTTLDNGLMRSSVQKSNSEVAGVVTNSETPTATMFSTNLDYYDTTFDRMIIRFTSGSLVGANSIIESYINTDGKITVAEPFVQAPAVDDQFVILTDSYAYPVDEISEALNVTVAPLQATSPNRVSGTEITAYINDTSDIGPIAITDSSGDPVDLSAVTLKVCIERVNGIMLANVTPTLSGAGNNQITFTPNAASVANTGTFRWSLRGTSSNQVYALGDFVVDPAARIS